jgi:hypothetical protein
MTVADLQAAARASVDVALRPRPWTDTTAPAASRVESLLEAMTAEEKLAQLGSKWLGFGAENSENVGPMQDAFSTIDVTFEQAAEHGLGHITRVFGTAPISARDGVARLVALQTQVVDNTRLGVPAIVHEECLTGFTTLGATVYPTGGVGRRGRRGAGVARAGLRGADAGGAARSRAAVPGLHDLLGCVKNPGQVLGC